MSKFLIVIALAMASSLTVSAAPIELKSPDGKLVVTFDIKTLGPVEGCPVYRVAYQGVTVLDESRLGVELAQGSLSSGLHIVRQERTHADSTWKPICGEREMIRDRYNQLDLVLQTSAAVPRALRLTFRAYDEGIAFCYSLPEQAGLAKAFTIALESTTFHFTDDHTAWAIYTAQGNYDGSEMPLSKIKPGVERPLTVRVADNLYAAITEARLVDYARMKLRPVKDQPHALEAFLDAEHGKYGQVTGSAPFTSPWRVVMVANSPGRLLEQNYLIPNLNDPCALADTSWIKPGKVIRETTFTTTGGKACVDFCVKRGLQFVEFDSGWYGNESDIHSDARLPIPEAKRNPDPKTFDLHEVIRYGALKGIGVILYVNQRALERQADEIFPLYEKWGVKGVKFGFVNVGSQHWTAWLHEAIRKAAACHLMVDIHDEFRNTGYQRTYPNLMTVEGIGGNEEFPTPRHNATLPFTRFLTGPADYTFCWYSGKLKTTHAHQLALSTIYFSPWQFLYWYDRPGMYLGEPALDYWKQLPTTWDETRVLQGEIGRRVSVARRKGNAWYVGTICPEGGTTDISLTFLDPAQQRYTATIYSDVHPERPESKDAKIETRSVDAATTLHVAMPANGGHAMRIVPAGIVSFENESSNDKPFVHPGLLHGRADLDRMKKLVAEGAEPWKSGFEKLRSDPRSQSTWKLRGPFHAISRDRRGSVHIVEFDEDASAAYQNALMWCITGDEAHAKKAIEIINAWSSNLQEITGSDRELAASLGGFKFVNAAELMRHTYPAWKTTDVQNCVQMLRRVVYPVIKEFAPFANGNWGAGCVKTSMAIGVFCDDRAIFDRAVDYFERGAGDAALTHYIINDAGQCQESGRDQQHAQLGLGHLADACEIGWHQGLNLYESHDNRLLKGFEYTAKYNLGHEVPFVSQADTTGKYFPKAISNQFRGRLRPIYEIVWNHYERRAQSGTGILPVNGKHGQDARATSFTRQAADKLRPEGAAFDADHPGFGTLLFSLPPEKVKKTASIEVKTEKPADQVKMQLDKHSVTLEVFSQTGIGGATVQLKGGSWPATVVLRFHLGGLESFAVSNGTASFRGSVLSHSGYLRLLSVSENGSEQKVEKHSPYFTDIRAFDAKGKPVDGLPGTGGYFELELPKALLKGDRKSIEVSWIDFFRG